jgi:chorismate mutase-like protein
MDIDQLRSRIDSLDQQLLALLNERACVALEIGREKAAHHLHIYHPERERDVLDQVLNANEGPLSDSDIRAVFELIIKTCKHIQREET